MTERKPQIRNADTRADAPRKPLEALFKDFNPEDEKFTGEYRVRNLPPGYFSYIARNDPTNINRLLELGYRTVEEVQTYLGQDDAVDVNENKITGNFGSNIQVMICDAEHRERRHTIKQQRQAAINRDVYKDDREMPFSAKRSVPPADYEPTD